MFKSSEIPIGAGLGSSAALSVCLAAGLTSVLRQVSLAGADFGDPKKSPKNVAKKKWAKADENIRSVTCISGAVFMRCMEMRD